MKNIFIGTTLLLSTLLNAEVIKVNEVPQEILAMHEQSGCDMDLLKNTDPVFQIDLYKTSEDSEVSLYKMLCQLGAYNTESHMYLSGEGYYSRISIPLVTSKTDISSTTDLINASYDDQSKTLEIYSKYRGIGDCGHSAKYKLVYEIFHLIEAYAKSDCDGDFSSWPQVYPF